MGEVSLVPSRYAGQGNVRSTICAIWGGHETGGGSVPVLRTVCSGEPDSQAHQGAAATQFSNSTETGRTPYSCSGWIVRVLDSVKEPGRPSPRQ
jgi:hypothetical protein